MHFLQCSTRCHFLILDLNLHNFVEDPIREYYSEKFENIVFFCVIVINFFVSCPTEPSYLFLGDIGWAPANDMANDFPHELRLLKNKL